MGRRRDKLKDHSLFVWACERMTPTLIQRLAACDVPWQTKANADSIRSIIESATVPGDLDWEPSEVCSLWSWGPDRNEDVDSHVINVWATCVLLIAGTSPDCEGRSCVGDGLSEKVGSLLWSVILLCEVFDEARVFFKWLAEVMDENFRNKSDYEPSSFARLALVIVHAHLNSEPSAIEAAAKAAFEAAQAENENNHIFRSTTKRWKHRPVLQLTSYGQHHALWEKRALNAHEMLAARKDAAEMPASMAILASVAGV